MTSAGARFRQALASGPVMIPGVFNALAAKMAERLGFSAVYMSGGALSAGWAGVPDVGLLTLTEFVEQARLLSRAVTLPLICDADTGFGEAINAERCVRLFEEADVAGIHLEDQRLPKRCGHLTGKDLVTTEEMVQKVRAAVSARRDDAFVIIARTDARSVEGFEGAVERARAYVEAGADMIFPEALETREEFERFAREVDAPLIANMTEFGRGPLLGFDELSALGYRAALFPLTAFRSAMQAAWETLAELKQSGTQKGRLGTMHTRADLYDLLGYKDWEARDKSYFSGH